MRLFFAIQPDSQLCMRLATWRERTLAADARAVPPANFHMTLAFLGEMDARSLESLCGRVDEYCNRYRPPGGRLVLDQTGYWHRPGIYWLGPTEWPPQLSQLADKLRAVSAACGGKRERKRWQPHITLFRGCREAPVAPASLPPMTLAYRDFALFESRQGRSGVSYDPVHYWDLADPP